MDLLIAKEKTRHDYKGYEVIIKKDTFVWEKGDNDVFVSANFKNTEFECSCSNPSCNLQLLSLDLIKKLQRIRDYYEKPIHVVSGFRCSKHQSFLTSIGAPTSKRRVSQHELGLAADIRFSGMDCGVDESMSQILKLVFDGVGLGERRIHVDVRGKSALWFYDH